MVVKKENIEEKLTNEKVIETAKPEIDIEALIQSTINRTVLETSKSFQEKIAKLEEQLKEKNSKVENNSENKSIKSDKMVKIMHIAPGGATFDKGRVRVTFNKLFDEQKIKFDILDEMYYSFREWFNNFEIVILDKEVREYYGIEYEYEENGADKDKFISTLKLNSSDMIRVIDRFASIPAVAFLKYFLDEYIIGNTDCFSDNKFNEISAFYKRKYGINDLHQIISELTDTK